jgi:hypothetical protein
VIRRISRISPWQAGKVFALLYFLMGLVFAVPLALITSLTTPAAGQPAPSVALVIAMPFLYALAGLIFVPIGCWIFNFVARIVGGIEVDVTGSEA